MEREDRVNISARGRVCVLHIMNEGNVIRKGKDEVFLYEQTSWVGEKG
jgi:hypothetical protein